MNHRLSLAGVALALVFSLGSAAHADTDYRTGRVSDLRGQLAVRGDDESDISYIDRNGVVREGDVLWTEADTGRAELELDRDVWVRLADDTKLEVRRLKPSAELRLWNGAVYLDVSDRLAEPVHLRTPSGDVDVDPKSLVRVDLGKGDSVRVSVVRGMARVTGDRGDTVKVRADERVYLDPNQDPERPKQFDVADRDAFDTYDRDRIDYIVSRPLPPHLEHDVIGARDLSDYGEWVEVDHVNYWRPRCGPDWRPYSAGYWSYVPGCGYSWIDSAPWGYTTCHYGRWLYRPTVGWLWFPSYEWAPAYVSWASYDGYCGWAPLDPWDHPAFCAAGGGSGFALSFRVGGVAFDYRSWSFCPTNQFYYSRAALVIAGGGHPYYSGRDIHISNTNITNVKIVNNYYNVVGVPQRTVRGLTVTRDGRSARDTVLRVENRIPEHRQALIQQRFKVEAKRDLVAARRPSEIEKFQRDPQPRVEAFHVVKGEEAARRAPAFANSNANRVAPAEARGVKPPADNPTVFRPSTNGGTGRGGDNGPGRASTGPGRNGNSADRPGDRDTGFRRGGDRAADRTGDRAGDRGNDRTGDRGGNRAGDRGGDRGTRNGDNPRNGDTPRNGAGRNDGSPSRTDSGTGRGNSGSGDRDSGFRRGGTGNSGSTGSGSSGGSNNSDRTGPRGNDRGGSTGSTGGDRTGPRGNDRSGGDRGGSNGTTGGDRTGPRGNDRGGSGTTGGDRTGPRGNDRSGAGSGTAGGERSGTRGSDRGGSGSSRGNDRGTAGSSSGRGGSGGNGGNTGGGSNSKDRDSGSKNKDRDKDSK